MAENIKIGIEAELTNYDRIVKSIKEGLENGLVDGVSDKALQKITNRLKTATEQLKIGNFDAALDTLKKIGSNLINISESINVAAGAAMSDLGQLTDKLNELKQQQRDIENNNPKARYRELEKTNPGHYVRSKASLQRDLVGLTSDAQWQSGKAVFTSANGEATTVDYGGKTWSINSAMTNLIQALNEGALTLTKEVQEAAKEFGYTLQQKDGVFTASRQDLTAQRKQEVDAYEARLAEAKARVAEAQLAVETATADVEEIRITAETGEFTNPIKDIVGSDQHVTEMQNELNQAIHEETKAQTKRSNAAEDARDAEDKLRKEVEKATSAQDKQTSTVGKAVTVFFGYQMVIRQLRRLWREAIHTITELDKQLTNQAIVTDLTREETWKLVSTYQDLADQAGVTQTEIAGVTTEYLRQGETLENALTLTKAATAAATVAGISASDSVKYLTTAIHGFQLEAEDALAVSDKFAALAAQAATNYESLAIALSKVASQAELAGMSMDYTLALLTTGLDVTQEAPESIGTALKTVIARMREISDYGKTLDDDVNLNQVESGLKAVGIELRNGIGELRSTEDVLDELGHKWVDLSANQQAAVAKALAGTRQQSRLVAIMENYDDVIKNMNVAQNSLGATTAQQVKYLQGMEAAMNRMQNAYQSLIESVIKSDTVIGVVNTIASLLKQVQKFLSQPAGKASLILGIISMLTRSKELMDKIRATINQVVQALSGIRKEEELITKEQEKQLDITKKELAASAGLTNNDLQKAGYGKAERPNGWMSNRAGESNFTDLISSLFKFGSGYTDRIKATASSWNQNNSPWAKISEHRADKANNKAMLDAETVRLQQQIELAKDSEAASKRYADAQRKAIEATNRAAEAEGELDAARVSNDDDYELEAEVNANAAQAQKDSVEKAMKAAQEEADIKAQAAAAQQDNEEKLSVLRSKQLSNAEKIRYLENKDLIAKTKNYTQEDLQRIKDKQARGEKLEAAELEVLKKDEVVRKAQGEVDATVNKGTGKQTGGKLGSAIARAAGIASAVSGIFSMIQGMVETIQNRYKEIANNAIDKATEIQSKIYNNTQTMTSLENLGNSLRELDRQVVKSADTMKELNDTRKQLLTELELTEKEGKLYTNQQLYDKAMAKRAQLENKNNELLTELGNTLLGAANNYDAGAGVMNILGKFATGAGLGAMATAGTGPMAIAGTAIGAVIGGVVGIVEEISKAIAANDAKGKVREMLQSDEGVNQMQYYFKAMYKNVVDTSTVAGQELANSVKTTYASLIDSLTGDDIEKLLDQYNWNTDQLAAGISNTLVEAGDALATLTADGSNYQERVAAAAEMYAKLNAQSEIIGKAFLQQYGAYVELSTILGSNVHYMDDFNWSMNDMNDLLSQLAEDGWGPQKASEAIAKLGDAMADGELTTEELTNAIGEMGNEAREAAEKLINGGMTMQELADQFTLAKNTVQTIRDTQTKWGTMNASDRQRFLDENSDFFNLVDEDTGKTAREAFYNGEDITKFLNDYKQQLQADLIDTTEKQIMATETKIFNLEQELSQDISQDQRDLLEDQLATTKRELLDLRSTYMDVQHMFDLTLSEVVEKQNQQISKLKEMYQAEEKALTDSLQKRREAYQKYFDGVAKAESLAEYNQNRTDLVNSIAKLGAGTDANSRNKVAELRRQLADLDKQEAQHEKEEARQALLENIDSEISRIQDSFEKLLSSDQELLKSMNENTYFQYLAYLAQSGQTEEAQQLAIQQMGDLLKGVWGTEGLTEFGSQGIAAETTAPSVAETQIDTSSNTFTIVNTSGVEERVTLSEQQMRQLVSQLLNTVNNWTGTSYKAK